MSRGGPWSGMRRHQIVIAVLTVGIMLALSGVNLDDTTVTGEVYVFLKSPRSLDRVEFYLDDPGRTRPPVRVDTIAPYDFAGTAADGRGNPYDTRVLSNGKHSITAVLRSSGSSSTRSAYFTVANETG